ncbi:MAG TPA: DUF3857 domain-containing protein [Candidatus Polarisedimenticolaceae bacterium]|nr:DUF3857 domain-containing protein [Candidatus Polarisedimenticolaceae bacterium]
MPRSRIVRALAGASALWVSLASPSPAADTRIDIQPGPTTLSDEERAIQVDPAKGIVHGVILVDETQLNDNYGVESRLEFHRRAKILSNEARRLADVEIVLESGDTLEAAWGRTLLADGRVLEVPDADVAEQDLARVGAWKRTAVRFALPGVVPGCLIDYGYTVKRSSLARARRVVLQRSWPVLRFRYRWRPCKAYTAAYRVYRSEGLDVHVERDRQSVLVTASDLPAVVDEPFMPPDHEVRASTLLYYLENDEDYKDYWEGQAKRIDKLSRIPSNPSLVERGLAAVGGAAATDLPTRLKAAYEWIAANVQNPLYAQQGAAERATTPAGIGSLDPLDKLFLDVARALGAEAHAVLAPDRRTHYWDTELHTLDQFDATVVAVRTPGAPDDQALMVDVESGLPFGEIPWWHGGVQGLLATSAGARAVFLAPSGTAGSVSRAVVELGFSDDGSQLRAKWTRTSRGQSGLDQSQQLGGRSDRAREESLNRMCGLGPDVEVGHAEGNVYYPPVTSQLTCESAAALDVPPATVDRYHLDWKGPWVAALPDLAAGPRVHPLIFDFSRVELLELSLKPPPGYRPSRPPPEVRFAGTYGKYALTFAATDEGYRVERALALLPLKVPPAEYAAFLEFLARVRAADATGLDFDRVEPRP